MCRKMQQMSLFYAASILGYVNNQKFCPFLNVRKESSGQSSVFSNGLILSQASAGIPFKYIFFHIFLNFYNAFIGI